MLSLLPLLVVIVVGVRGVGVATDAGIGILLAEGLLLLLLLLLLVVVALLSVTVVVVEGGEEDAELGAVAAVGAFLFRFLGGASVSIWSGGFFLK